MPHGTALVGVGSAGKTHYSVSVSAAPEGGLRFEFACRLITPAGWLGTTYTAGSAAATLAIEPLDGALAKTSAAADGSVSTLQILPATPPAGCSQKVSTVQWNYRVWVPDAD